MILRPTLCEAAIPKRIVMCCFPCVCCEVKALFREVVMIMEAALTLNMSYKKLTPIASDISLIFAKVSGCPVLNR